MAGVLSTFKKSLGDLEAFTEAVDSDTSNVFKSVAKTFSDSLHQESCIEEASYQNLPPLIIKNFDDEQVWQQLELRNTLFAPYRPKYCKTFDSFGVENSTSQECLGSKTTDIDLSSEGDSEFSFEESDSDDSSLQKSPIKFSETKSEKILNQQRKYNSSSAVDDKFFKLSQLAEYLKYSDLQEERGHENAGSDDDIDLFADIPSDAEAIDDDDSDGEEKSKKQKSSREIMYKDFFDLPEDEENEYISDQKSAIHDNKREIENRKHGDVTGKGKTVSFSQDIETDKKLQLLDDSDQDSMLNENSEYKKPIAQTTVERQQGKEREQIQKVEESLIKAKPWQLTGEVASDKRQQDSLVHKNLDFDSNLKMDFISTDEITERVENIIRKAIENKAWCDVEIKVRPVEDALKYKYTEPLNQAKSEKSLAEVYEEEYKKKHEEQEGKEDPRHVEIRKLMDSVVITMSNLFSHTPRPPIPEIKVVNNMPAITLEEVAPVGVSDAALLAPEEIKSTWGLPISKSERTETDKKRERRKKKKLQKIKKLEKEERERKKAEVSEKAASKFAKQQALKKLSQQKNVTIVQDKKYKRKSRNA